MEENENKYFEKGVILLCYIGDGGVDNGKRACSKYVMIGALVLAKEQH